MGRCKVSLMDNFSFRKGSISMEKVRENEEHGKFFFFPGMHYQLLKRWLSNRELTVVYDVWQLIFVRLYLNTIPAPPQ